ncbi:MAG TPA: pyridoxamine 5'-phosphate oxidase family protein [Burkholderiaceae bacterium]|jgi:hypothetical protein
MNPASLKNWPHPGSPFHPISQAIQEKMGVAEQLEAFARRGVTNVLTEQHRAFFSQLPFVVAGSVDKAGQPWATLLFGKPGFMNSVEPGSLQIDAVPLSGDPLSDRFLAGTPVGLLGIDPTTRRRNRANGRVSDVGTHGFSLHVEQAFGNCPKYIRNRSLHRSEIAAPERTHLFGLDAVARRMIEQADTFFIASAFRDGIEGRVPFHGVDVSHRGGKQGFVHVSEDGTLTVPDFVGNYQFRTIGNLLSEPRAGLLFPDFTGGGMLYVAVTSEVLWDGPEVDAFAGAERLLRFRVHEMIRLENAMPLRFEDGQASTFLEGTGSWR